MNPIFRLLSVFLLFAGLVSVLGCGMKAWPEPQDDQDAFTFAKVSFEREKDCLLLKAIIQGNADNLDHFVLFLEQDGCPTCPFLPEKRVAFFLSDERIRMLGDTIQISYCGLAPQESLRFRMLGVNSMENLPPADSGVLQ